MTTRIFKSVHWLNLFLHSQILNRRKPWVLLKDYIKYSYVPNDVCPTRVSEEGIGFSFSGYLVIWYFFFWVLYSCGLAYQLLFVVEKLIATASDYFPVKI